MTLYQLKVFATVAKLRNFTQAADNLRVRQPSVSLLVKGLERELEIKLFEKLGNKIHLTVAGEKLLQRAEEILAKAEGIKEEIDEIKGLKKGKIRVGGSAIPAASFLPMAVQKFKNKHPNVEVEVTIQSSNAMEKDLLKGELDVGILGRPAKSPLLTGEWYRDEQVVAIVSPRHPLTKKRYVPFKLLAKEPLIIQGEGAPIRPMIERRFAEEGLPLVIALEAAIEFGARDAIKSAVASGLGIGLISKSHVIWDVRGGRLKLLRVPDLNLKRSIYIVGHKNRQNSPLIQAFIQILRDLKET